MIFPAPHARETISSFGYRIARLCCLASLPELTHMLDIDLQALLRGDAASIGQFARHARCDPDRLSRAALDARNTRRLRIGVGQQPRGLFAICSACLSVLSARLAGKGFPANLPWAH